MRIRSGLRQIAKIGRFLLYLALGDGKDRTEAAGRAAMVKETLPEWEENHGITEKLLLADGAEWWRDRDGNWCLLKSPRTEKDAAMFELLKHLHVPVGMNVEDAKKRFIHFGSYATLADGGMSLPERYLKRSRNPKGAQGQPQAAGHAEGEGAESPHTNGQKAGDHADGACSTGQAPIDGLAPVVVHAR